MSGSPAISVRDLHKSYGNLRRSAGSISNLPRGKFSGCSARMARARRQPWRFWKDFARARAERFPCSGSTRPKQAAEVKDRIGVCLQATNLPDKMRVREALKLFSAFYSQSTDPAPLLQRLQLWDKRDAFYKSLSGGQKQRVALALALLNDPALLFLDEPTTGLDPQVRHEIHGIIQELKENRRSILLTTHYIEEAERLCDRVAIIDAGKIIESGTPREIQQRVLGHTPRRDDDGRRHAARGTLPERLRDEKHSRSDDEGRTISMQTESPAATIVELVRWIESEKV